MNKNYSANGETLMAGLPKKYAKMGFKKGWAAYKKSKKKSTPKRKPTKRKAAPRRRRSTMARGRRKQRRRTKKYKSVSIMSIGHAAMQYSNLTGMPLGTVVNEVVMGIVQGNSDPIDVLMTQATAALNNVTENPAGIAIRAALIAFLFSQGRSLIGKKCIFTVGKWKLTV